MNKRLFSMLMLCSVSIMVTAQSFSSLRRSSGSAEVYEAVEKVLSGNGKISNCVDLIKSGDIGAPKNGMTPIYLVLDYIATHRKQDCAKAEQMLEAFVSRGDFDINARYSSLAPPLSYLLSKNYAYLGRNYSKDYISDNVLRIMIEAGASINSYNTLDGSTLMDFALATDNLFLQNYALKEGVNLRHKNNNGEDVVARLIYSGKYDIVKESVESGKIHIDITNLNVDPSRFIQHKELYSYLANHCANQANTYEQIVKFQSKFPSEKGLVQAKYELIARDEVARAQDYNSIVECKKRYPDLAGITEPKYKEIALSELNATGNIADFKICEKHYPDLKNMFESKKRMYYQKDVVALESSFAHAKRLIAQNSFDYEEKMSDIVYSFIKNYQNYYDPDDKLSLANDLRIFFSALSKVATIYPRPYINLPNPGIDNAIKTDRNNLQAAYSDLSRCGHGLSSMQMLNAINEKIQSAIRWAEESVSIYADFCGTLSNSLEVNHRESPKGDLYKGLLDSYYKYNIDGTFEIRYKGPHYSWNITLWYNAHYKDKKTFEYYEVRHIVTYKVALRWYNVVNASDRIKLYEAKSVADLEKNCVNMIIKYYYSFL